MNNHIKIFRKDSNQYKQLEKAIQCLQKKYPERKFWIEVTYFDAGQDWKWTTILTRSEKLHDNYQLLTPKRQKDILNCQTKEELQNYINSEL